MSAINFTSDNNTFSLLNDGQQVGATGRNLHVIAAVANAGPAVAGYIDAALANSTRRAYRSDLADFLTWPGGHVPCAPEVLAAYLADRAQTLSPHTICRRVVAVARAHTSRGWQNPADSELVRTVLRGIRKAHGAPQRQAAPLLRDELLCLLPRAEDVISVRDRALLLLGFASAMRRSELVSIDCSDLRFVAHGMEIYLRRSKTDQEGAGRTVAVPHGKSQGTCPVAAVRQWLERAEITSGPIFRAIRKGGQVQQKRLNAQSVGVILRARAASADFDTNRLSAHSLRVGLVTSAAQAGIPAHKIMAQTGHRSFAMLNRYIRDANLFENNAASVL